MAAKRKIVRAQSKRKSATKPSSLRVELQKATAGDALEIAALRNAAAEKLTAKYGQGPWSGNVSDKGVLFNMRQGSVFLLKEKNQTIATLTLSKRKPWAIDKQYFAPAKRPLYLTAMAVAPDLQLKGIGRRCLEAALKKCKEDKADAIRLDAYDNPAGAGGFYEKCGFVEIGRASYRGAALVYYEMLL